MTSLFPPPKSHELVLLVLVCGGGGRRRHVVIVPVLLLLMLVAFAGVPQIYGQGKGHELIDSVYRADSQGVAMVCRAVPQVP